MQFIKVERGEQERREETGKKNWSLVRHTTSMAAVDR